MKKLSFLSVLALLWACSSPNDKALEILEEVKTLYNQINEYQGKLTKEHFIHCISVLNHANDRVALLNSHYATTRVSNDMATKELAANINNKLASCERLLKTYDSQSLD